MSIIEIIESRIARALRGLRFPYRARLTARNDAPGLQLAQADALAGEQAQAVEVLQQFGFSSGVPEGSDLIVVPLGGRTSASVIIATENAAYRLKVGPGEARMYSQEGAYIHIKQGRVIEIDCDELAITVKNNARLTVGQQVTVEAGSGIVLDTPQTTVTGNMTATGQKGDRVEMTADMTLRGNITQTGSITSSGDHTAGGISLTGHTHTGVQTGGGSTGKPQ
ncbi:phage baseplate assembly protein V [Desulfovibrio sp.]|uniref:phage baseplate assembly protein V n=1 Tax=Desulfovibrio sp. TaxID=885 RepID=UPI003AF905BA